MRNTAEKKLIALASFGSPYSYELQGDYLVPRFLGCIPAGRVHLGAVNYLRLATRSETPLLYFILNWQSMLLAGRRASCPVYVIQTRAGRRLFLKLKGGDHFRLRQAIARHSDKRRHKMAA